MPLNTLNLFAFPTYTFPTLHYYVIMRRFLHFLGSISLHLQDLNTKLTKQANNYEGRIWKICVFPLTLLHLISTTLN